jgi:hypothetical protein
MEGGRVKDEFADVNEITDELPPPPSKDIVILRNIINDFKNSILDSLTSEDLDEPPEKAQDVTIIDVAISRLQKLSNILTDIISESNNLDYVNDIEDIESILKVFESKKLDINNIDDKTRELCLYYINNDLNVLMFDRR